MRGREVNRAERRTMGAPQRDQWRIGPKCLSAVNSGRFIDPGRERVDGRIPQDLRKKPSRHDYRFAPPRGRSPPTASDDCSKRWEKKRVLGIKFNRVVSKRVCHESRQLSSFAQVVRLRQFRYVSRFRLVVHMSGDQDLRIALLGSWREHIRAVSAVLRRHRPGVGEEVDRNIADTALMCYRLLDAQPGHPDYSLY